MILEKTRFHYFEIHDLEMDGGQQTEWRDCAFENSAFENTKLCANISIAHGWLWNCKGQQIDMGREAVWKENTLKNCMINGEIVKN